MVKVSDTQDIDRQLGRRLQYLRKSKRCSREALAAHLEMTATAVWFYEIGRNRIPAAKLVKASRFLNVDIRYFFEFEADDD